MIVCFYCYQAIVCNLKVYHCSVEEYKALVTLYSCQQDQDCSHKRDQEQD